MTNTNNTQIDFKMIVGAYGKAVHNAVFAPSRMHRGEVLARPACSPVFEKPYVGMRDNLKVSHRVSADYETTCKRCLDQG